MTVSRKVKSLGIYQAKEVKDLYSGNYSTLKKGTVEDIRSWKDVPISSYTESALELPYFQNLYVDLMQSH